MSAPRPPHLHVIETTFTDGLNPRPITELALYEAARVALAEAHRVDEVKNIRDRWAALLAAARIAKNTELICYATGIRLRAERRAGELLHEMELNKGGGDRRSDHRSHGATGDEPTLVELGFTKTQSSRFQKLAALPADKFEIRAKHAEAKAEFATTSAPSECKAAFTGDSEWFTPSETIEAAREVLGEIDLDPASHEIAQATVRAKRFHTVADDGLVQTWSGRVWLNPPFTRGLIEPFVDKLIAEVRAGSVVAAIVLAPNYTDTGWWHRAARAATSICIRLGRVRFEAPSGEECSLRDGQTFFYYGPDPTRFKALFSQLGLIMRIDTESPHQAGGIG